MTTAQKAKIEAAKLAASKTFKSGTRINVCNDSAECMSLCKGEPTSIRIKIMKAFLNAYGQALSDFADEVTTEMAA